MTEPVPHITDITYNGWTGVLMLFLLLGYLLSLGLSWRQYTKRLSSLGKQRIRMVNYEDEVIDWRANLLLYVSVILSIALAFFSFIVGFGWVAFSPVVFLIVVGVTCLFLLLKYWVARIICSIFALSIYVADMKMRVVYTVLGILSLLISMIVAHYDVLNLSLVLFAIFVVACLIAEFVILVENFFRKTGSLFYIFLYLCAAEILPLLVGFRIATQVLN